MGYADVELGAKTVDRHETTIDKPTDTDNAQPRLYYSVSREATDIQTTSAPSPQSESHRTHETQRGNVVSLPSAELTPQPLILTSKAFTDGFVPPDYLIDGVVQRRFLYSLTGNNGAGKTAIALRIAAHVALGRPIGEYAVEKGRVLYFAGENPDDLRMRWIALSEHLDFDRTAIDVHFVDGADKEIAKVRDQIAREVAALDGVSLVVVDTSAAYFNCDECDDENDNVQAGKHARMFRSLTSLPGGPSVLVLAHPPKNAKSDNLLPRGGGAFIAEVDGNLVVRKNDALAELHWQGKYRGAEFEPISFELPTVTAAELRDSKDRPIRTVLAVPLSDEDRAALEARQDQDGNSILALMSSTPGQSLMDMAKALGWKTAKGQPDKRRTQKGMERLRRSKLVAIDTDTKRYKLTKTGLNAAAAIKIEPMLPTSSTVPLRQ